MAMLLLMLKQVGWKKAKLSRASLQATIAHVIKLATPGGQIMPLNNFGPECLAPSPEA